MTDLIQLQQAILTECEAITGIQTVASEPQRLDQITLPALLVDWVELTPAQDLGTGELMLDSHWEMRFIVSEQQAHSVTIALLQSVLRSLYYQRWGLRGVDPLQLKQVIPDHMTPTLQGHHIWLIEWTQTIALGECVWDANGIVPTMVTVNIHA